MTKKMSSLLSASGTKSPLTSLGIVGPVAGGASAVVGFVLANWDTISTGAGLAWTLGSALFAAATGAYGRWRATKNIA